MNRHSLYIALLAALLTACAADITDTTGSPELTGEPEAVAFALNGSTTATRTTTLDDLWPTGTAISVSNGTTSSDGTPVVHVYKTQAYTGTPVAGDAAALEPETAGTGTQFYWPVSDPSWTFTAWYPSGGTAAPGELTVSADQRADESGSNGIKEATYLAYDLMYGQCEPTFRQKPVPLVLHHQLARVIVKVNSFNTEKKEKVEAVSFGAGKLGLKGTIATRGNGTNGTTKWNITSTQDQSINMRDRTTTDDANACKYTFECLVLPQSNGTEQDALVLISTSGAVNNLGTPIDRTYKYKDKFDLKAGHQYTYELTISEQGTVTLTTVKVIAWDGTPVNVPAQNVATIPDNAYPDIPTP